MALYLLYVCSSALITFYNPHHSATSRLAITNQQHKSVDTVDKLRAGQPASFPDRGESPDRLGARQPLIRRVTEVLSRVQNGWDVKLTTHHLLPVKNQWSYNYSLHTPPLCARRRQFFRNLSSPFRKTGWLQCTVVWW